MKRFYKVTIPVLVECTLTGVYKVQRENATTGWYTETSSQSRACVCEALQQGIYECINNIIVSAPKIQYMCYTNVPQVLTG